MKLQFPKTKPIFEALTREESTDWFTQKSTFKIAKTWFENETLLQLFHSNDNNDNIYHNKERMRFLRFQKKPKLSLAFFQPWKKIVPPLTRRQRFLHQAYINYRDLRIKDRLDFFRSHIGQMMLNTELHSQTPKSEENTWFSKRTLIYFDDQTYFENKKEYDQEHWNDIFNAYIQEENFSGWENRSWFANLYKKIWWYDNLIQKKRKPYMRNDFVLDRPQTAFQIHWQQRHTEPWKNALLFRRAVYSGFGESFRRENKFKTLKIRPYLRRKNPRSEKRNQLYKRSSFLLYNYRQHNRIYAQKAARIKNIMSKIVWPFYGNLRPKQIRIMATKSKRVKSKILTQNEILLNHLENRLDVVIYRLNLAPTILWARRLIENGSVFVTPQKSTVLWDSMYASLKKIAFPLKLRDPKKIYSSQLWRKEYQSGALFKFLGQPQKKISYLLQAGDLIQCTAGNSLHQFKTKSLLWQKPLPTHLLTKKEPHFFWSYRYEELMSRSFNNWEQNQEYFNAAIFLHAPRFQDLSANDRMKESFLRWTIL